WDGVAGGAEPEAKRRQRGAGRSAQDRNLVPTKDPAAEPLPWRQDSDLVGPCPTGKRAGAPRTACPASPSLRFRLRLARSLHRPEMFARDGFCRGSRTTPRSRAEPHAVEHFAGARPGHGLVWLWPEELEHAGITPADLNTPVGVDEPVAAAARIVRRPGQRRRRRRRPPRL